MSAYRDVESFLDHINEPIGSMKNDLNLRVQDACLEPNVREIRAASRVGAIGAVTVQAAIAEAEIVVVNVSD